MITKKSLIPGILMTGLSLYPGGFASDTRQPEGETSRINRLVGLCKLWSAVKYFHPALAYRADIDFDKVLVDTIPKVNAAKTHEEYQAALQSMLAVLDDPLTHIVDGSASPTPTP